MPALASVDQVAARVGELIEDDVDVMLAEACLDEASALVRFYGSQAWLTPEVTPEAAVAIVVAAAARGYQNPAGYDTERADMASFRRGEQYKVGCELTVTEIAMLRDLAGGSGIISAPLSNPEQIVPRSHRGHYDRGYRVFDFGDKPFPWGP